jgi:predicted extracellular nuclease
MSRQLAICWITWSVTLIPGAALASTPAGLFFSEYVEGSSFNKAIEIYNDTGAPVDLAAGNYSVEMYFNGSASPGMTIDLAAEVADGDVFVLAHASADPAILAQTDQTSASLSFNGDDAVVLRNATAILDVFGQVGFDPGTEWGSGSTSTQDNTLRRMTNCCAGDTNGTDAFDPSAEWDGVANNRFDGLGVHAASCAAEAEPRINEFSASTTGTDLEYVEVIGSPDTDHSAYRVLEIDGDTSSAGVVDEIIAVGTTDASGRWLGNLPANALESGSLTLLLVRNFSGALGQDLDLDDDGSFDSTPWDAIADAVAVADGGAGDLAYGAPVLGPNYDGVSLFAPGGASRFPDGFDTEAATDWVRNDFDLAGIPGFSGTLDPGEALNTPGAFNAVYESPAEGCADSYTPIYAIQGNGPASPLVGNEVSTEGVVVGDFQLGGFNGFFLQDAAGDADAATSDGIFAFAPGALDVNLGDSVRVRGRVDEHLGLTELTGVRHVWLCSTGNAVAPVPVSLPTSNPDDLEPFEGMLVTIPQTLYISEFFNFDRFGEIVLTTQRQYQPTSREEPGSPEAAQLASANRLGRITLDDGRGEPNPDPALHPNGAVFDLANRFRGGDGVKNVTGVMDYSFGLYRIQPTQAANYLPLNPRPARPDDVGGSLKVASFNLLNYFTTLDSGAGFGCGPAADQQCRGADSVEEFIRQRDKIIAALTTMDAAVVGLIEIENQPSDAPTADLVSGLNDVLGAGTYASIATGAIGTDAIRSALIYQPGKLSPLGAHAILDASVDSRFLDAKNRPALAQTFRENATGGIFTVVVNHLKSKGSDCSDVGDPDLGDGAGNCNLTRKAAAEALVDWLDTDPTGSSHKAFLVIGDLNSYDNEDPIDALVAGGYGNLLREAIAEAAYSYLFDGQLGHLDHAFASPGLRGAVTGATAWHINADEPDVFDYDTTFKQPAQDALYEPNAYRSSDHDPLIVGLAICDAVPPTLEVSLTPDSLWPANHKSVEVVGTVVARDDSDPAPNLTLVYVTSNELDNGLGDGDTANDIVVLDDFRFQLRAERSGAGSGRIYTIRYMATDSCGNVTYESATVSVPKSQAKQK